MLVSFCALFLPIFAFLICPSYPSVQTYQTSTLVFLVFPFVCINTYMNDKQAEQLRDKWLTDNGITKKQFNTVEMWQLLALKTTNYLMKNKIELLTNEEQNKLITFFWAMKDKKKRQKITKRMTYEIMNISTKIKRKEYKEKKSR
jgi:hypothetical protein